MAGWVLLVPVCGLPAGPSYFFPWLSVPSCVWPEVDLVCRAKRTQWNVFDLIECILESLFSLHCHIRLQTNSNVPRLSCKARYGYLRASWDGAAEMGLFICVTERDHLRWKEAKADDFAPKQHFLFANDNCSTDGKFPIPLCFQNQHRLHGDFFWFHFRDQPFLNLPNLESLQDLSVFIH